MKKLMETLAAFETEQEILPPENNRNLTKFISARGGKQVYENLLNGTMDYEDFHQWIVSTLMEYNK